MKVRYSRLALAELDAILSDLAAKNPAAAQHFENKILQVGERIGRFPHGFQEVVERPGVRRVPLVRYPYLNLLQSVCRRGDRTSRHSRCA
jgi:plasmid stabilization system protein ParE